MHRHHGIEFDSAEACAFCTLIKRIVELEEQLRDRASSRAHETADHGGNNQ